MAFVAAAAAGLVVATRRTVVIIESQPVERPPVARQPFWPQRTVRISYDEILYQGRQIARVPACPDSPCFKLDALYQDLVASEPTTVPPGAFDPARFVALAIGNNADLPTEHLVLSTISAAGYYAVVLR